MANLGIFVAWMFLQSYFVTEGKLEEVIIWSEPNGCAGGSILGGQYKRHFLPPSALGKDPSYRMAEGVII